MSDGKPVRATTADEEAVMFQQSWVKAEREANRLRAENEKLRAALKPFAERAAAVEAQYQPELCEPKDNYLLGVKYGDLRAAATAYKETE